FGVEPRIELPPHYNLAPGQNIATIISENGKRRLVMLRWGFPVRSMARPLMNVRGETVDTNASFRDAFRNRRCLIPATGFYEWRDHGKGPKQPYFIRPKNGEPIAMAGIWEGDVVAIITSDANAELSKLHHRMPVIVMPADRETWLSGTPENAKALVRPAQGDLLDAYPVGLGINRAANDGPELVEPLKATMPRQRDLF
ncbi:MAG: SOS response-associated peptidase, partial [Nitrosotalea sp.]